MRILYAAFALVLIAAQPPDIRARVDAYVKALSSGSPDQFEAMATENFTPELLARTAAQRRSMVARVHDDFGEIAIANARMSSATHVELDIESQKNSMPLTITMDFEAAAPHRIASVSLRAGGPAGGGRGGPAPIPPAPISATMPGDELSLALGAYLGGLAAANDFAGVVLVAKDGQIIFEDAYGSANRPAIQRRVDWQGVHENGDRPADSERHAEADRHARRSPPGLSERRRQAGDRRSVAAFSGRRRRLLR
jgi:hypothetical protein